MAVKYMVQILIMTFLSTSLFQFFNERVGNYEFHDPSPNPLNISWLQTVRSFYCLVHFISILKYVQNEF